MASPLRDMTRACAWCETTLPPASKTGRLRAHCSRSCWAQAARAGRAVHVLVAKVPNRQGTMRRCLDCSELGAPLLVEGEGGVNVDWWRLAGCLIVVFGSLGCWALIIAALLFVRRLVWP